MYIDPFIVGFVTGYICGMISLFLLAIICTGTGDKKNGKEKDV